jgi:hypothetical protein
VKPTPAVLPHACVILAVDTARRSGWSLWALGQLLRWGETDVLVDRWVARLCAEAIEEGRRHNMPVFLVVENPFRGTNQGQYRGNWKAAFVQAGGQAKRIVGVHPSVCRARVLGGSASRAQRETVRKQEQAVALWWTQTKTIGPDAAASVCIGAWARLCGEIGKRMPKGGKGKAK